MWDMMSAHWQNHLETLLHSRPPSAQCDLLPFLWDGPTQSQSFMMMSLTSFSKRSLTSLYHTLTMYLSKDQSRCISRRMASPRLSQKTQAFDASSGNISRTSTE